MVIQNQEKCVICLDEMNNNDELYFFPNCTHIIHQKCFIEYMQNNSFNLCPICRKSIVNKLEIIINSNNNPNYNLNHNSLDNSYNISSINIKCHKIDKFCISLFIIIMVTIILITK